MTLPVKAVAARAEDARWIKRWRDFLTFHAAQVETQDLDPAYPVLRAILNMHGVASQSDSAIWLSICHVTWYDIGSALRAWYWMQDHKDDPNSLIQLGAAGLPCATERRGNRNPETIIRNLTAWVEFNSDWGGGSILHALSPKHSMAPGAQWTWTRGLIETVWGNGRWAAYKLAELLQKVNGLPLKPLDMGHEDSTGPRAGMELLVPNLPQGNSPEDITNLDVVSASLCDSIQRLGMKGLVEEVETSLCDFHALYQGRYYVGHDIDAMQVQMERPDAAGVATILGAARRVALPHAYLGELNGRTGVDLDRNAVYKQTGEVVLR